MYAGTMPRLAGADPSSIAFDDGQFGRTGRTHRQGLVRLWVSIATLGQFGTDVVHYPLDRLGGNLLIAYLFHDDSRPLERACLGGGDSDPLHQSGVSSRASKPIASRRGEAPTAFGAMSNRLVDGQVPSTDLT